jgi:hypothetical protein
VNRIIQIDVASAPLTPPTDNRLRYVATAPVCVFFLLLGAKAAKKNAASKVASFLRRVGALCLHSSKNGAPFERLAGDLMPKARATLITRTITPHSRSWLFIAQRDTSRAIAARGIDQGVSAMAGAIVPKERSWCWGAHPRIVPEIDSPAMMPSIQQSTPSVRRIRDVFRNSFIQPMIGDEAP